LASSETIFVESIHIQSCKRLASELASRGISVKAIMSSAVVTPDTRSCPLHLFEMICIFMSSTPHFPTRYSQPTKDVVAVG